jgi:ATP-dependent RNA helicase RhlE
MLKQTPTGRVLIFTRTKHRARNLAQDLEKHSYRVSALQGNMTQNRRQDAINGFRDGKYDILVATDIASRGIDVQEISHVINFDMPNTVDAYTHRIGRTGRASQTGEAFTFTGQADETMIREIEHVLGARIERRKLPDFDYSGFPPESPSRQGRPGRTRELPSPRTYSRVRKGYDRVSRTQESSGQPPARRSAGNESGINYTSPRRPPQRRQFAASSAKRTW